MRGHVATGMGLVVVNVLLQAVYSHLQAISLKSQVFVLPSEGLNLPITFVSAPPFYLHNCFHFFVPRCLVVELRFQVAYLTFELHSLSIEGHFFVLEASNGSLEVSPV